MSDENISQFLAFTGSSDTNKAASYLEMAGGNVETAVGLYLEHQGGGGGGLGGPSGGGGGGFGGGGGMDDVRAPDATRTMRLMDDGPMMGGGAAAMLGGYMPMMDPMLEERLRNTAFSNPREDSARDAVNQAASGGDNDNMAMDSDDDDDEYDYKEDDSDDNEPSRQPKTARLSDMFAAPEHLIFKEGGFEGARNMAKDSKRWLLVNLQRDSEFSCHALNRDVWRDELVENLVREGFIFWQAMDISPEGKTYAQRYHVYDYPHIAFIDPRTRRLMWKKEGWTQEKPMTAELFAETAMDFCSRHSFDKPPVAPRPGGAAASKPSNKRPMTEMSEDEQLQAAMRASLEDVTTAGTTNDNSIDIDDDDDVKIVGATNTEDSKPSAKPTNQEDDDEKKPSSSSFLDELVSMPLGDEPATGARIQLRMPDGKRIVRKFDASLSVKTIYAFIAQSVDEKNKEFVLKAGFPPKDLINDIDKTIESCKLSGEAIAVRWKE